MKNVKIPDWLYEKLITLKNQYYLSNRLTSNVLAADKYQEMASKIKTEKEKFFDWLKKEDYCPEIPAGVIVKIWHDSFVKFGIDEKHRNKTEKYLLQEKNQFDEDLK